MRRDHGASIERAVTVLPSAAHLRRAVGPTAWVVLESLLQHAEPTGVDEYDARRSIRELAADLGLAKDTVARAMRVLRDVRLVTHVQRRTRVGAFDPGRYSISLPSDVVSATSAAKPSPTTEPRAQRASTAGQMSLTFEASGRIDESHRFNDEGVGQTSARESECVPMMRVTTLFAGTASTTAAYYTAYLTQAEGELPGQWMGRQADGLGLHGTVTTEHLEAVLSGRDPNTGTPLGKVFADRTKADGTVVRAVAGFDATLSAPKSLSAWWALTGDDRLAGCHDVAVAAVVQQLERFGATTRIRHSGGRLHPDTHGLTIAAFRQSTSRADDPQLHTHLVISSKVQTDDGRWLALDARLLKGHQRAIGGLYQSVLRAELTNQFGARFGEIVNGQAEIIGVPDALIDRYSKRSVEVDRAVTDKLTEFWERQGRDPTSIERAAIGREAAADTRRHKTGDGVNNLRTRWQREANDIGVTAVSLTASITAAHEPEPRERKTTHDIIERLSTEQSAWHRMDVLRVVTDTIRPVAGHSGERWAAAIDRAVDAVMSHCIDLDPTHESNTRQRFSDHRSIWIEPTARHMTSDAVIRQEEYILTFAADATMAAPAPSATVPTDGLDPLQADAAAAVAGHDRLVLVVGPAGTGKTTMLRAAVSDLDCDGRPAFGLAPTAKAAHVLRRRGRVAGRHRRQTHSRMDRRRPSA